MPEPTPTLTDEQQRYQIAAAADHGPETCDCDAYAPENGYPDNLICDALADTFAVVARMVADAEQRGRAEALREFARKWADWTAQGSPQIRGGAAYRAICEAQALESADQIGDTP